MKKIDMNISILRIISTIGVIWLHINSTIVDNLDLYNIRGGGIYYFFSFNLEIMKFAVPIFLMITGVLLLNSNKKIRIPDLFSKYILKIFLALLLFGTFFAFLILLFENKSINLMMIMMSFLYVLVGKSFSHLWYLYALIGFYLILPMLKKYVDNSSQVDIKYLLIILFLFNFVFKFFNIIFNINIAFTLPLNYIIFYPLLGYYIYNYHKNINKLKYYMISVMVFIVVIFLFNYFSIDVSRYLNYDSPFIAIYSALIFQIFLNFKYFKYSKKVWKLDRLCFGVYLIHPIFIQFFYKFLNLAPIGSNYIVISLLYLLIFTLLSFAISFVMNLIKPMNKYILS